MMTEQGVKDSGEFAMGLVNIIVPIYGVEDYLPRCVESLLAQTYQNIRIILVDDASPDQCPQLCDGYEKTHQRIVTIHRPNGGQSAARNSGLEYVWGLESEHHGEYIAFVDPDDWVESNYIERLVKLMRSSEADVVQTGHYISYSPTREKSKDPQNTKAVLTREQALESLCRNGIWDVTAWNKLYKLDVFRTLRFPEGKLYEDTAIAHLIVAKGSRFAVDMTPTYHYVQRYTSTANGTTWKDSKLDFLEAGDALADWVETQYPQLTTAAIEKRVFVRLSTLAQMVNTNYRNDALAASMRKFILGNASTILTDRRASLRDKLGIVAISCGYPCFRLVWKNLYMIRRHKFAYGKTLSAHERIGS